MIIAMLIALQSIPYASGPMTEGDMASITIRNLDDGLK